MFGHTHDQYFSVTNSASAPDKHINVSQIGPSGTSHELENPAYAVIELDAETLLPLNYQIYSLDLEKANASNKAEWKLTVDYIKDYKMKDMSPDAMYKLAGMIRVDPRVASLYKWNMSRNVGKHEPSCDLDCRKELACMLRTSEVYETDDCMQRHHRDWFSDPGTAIADWLIGDKW